MFGIVIKHSAGTFHAACIIVATLNEKNLSATSEVFAAAQEIDLILTVDSLKQTSIFQYKTCLLGFIR